MAAQEPRIWQNYSIPVTDGSTVLFNNITTTPAQVLPAAPERKKITFHNPNYDGSTGGVDLLVSQSKDIAGSTITATFASPGGGFVIFGGSTLTIEGDAAGGAWKACARSGSTNGITIVTSNSVG